LTESAPDLLFTYAVNDCDGHLVFQPNMKGEKAMSHIHELKFDEIHMVSGGHDVYICLVVDGKIVKCEPVVHEHLPTV
jgi:hypothetical protein